MNHKLLINQQLQQLAPALKSQRKARQLLEEYWSDKMALLWTTQQVHRAANEKETVLTESEALTLLQSLSQSYDSQDGLCWKNLTDAIQDSGYGRDITKAELNRFIHQALIAVQNTPTNPKKGKPQ